MIYENGVLLAETERFPDGDRRSVADVDLDLLRQERVRMGTFDDNRRTHADAHRTTSAASAFTLDPPDGDLGLRRELERFPFVPADPDRLEQDCYEAYNIQVAGLQQRLDGDRRPEGRHRRLGRPGLHPRADRRREGDGPRGPPAQRHPRLHAARASRPATGTKANAHKLMARARRSPRRSSTSPPTARLMLEEIEPPVRARRGGLRRHVRERPGRPAHGLPVPDRQPARRDRARHGRPLRARARLGDLRRRRPDEPLQRQRRRPEDAHPAPDPLGRLAAASSTTRSARRSTAILDTEISPELVPGEELQSTESKIGPYALHDFTLFHVAALRLPAVEDRLPRLARVARRRRGRLAARTSPRPSAAPTTWPRSAAGSRSSASASSPSRSSSARRCRTGRRSRPAARSRRAATGARRRTARADGWLRDLERWGEDAWKS